MLHALSTLNLPLLSSLLDPTRTYQDASKEVFLQKMSEVFEEFKKLGDKKLKPYPGKCASCECSNKGKTGYCFVGKSGSYINLIIEEDESGVTDIYDCSEFKSKAQVTPFFDIPLRIAEDEKKSFEPSAGYLIKSVQCQDAFEEMLALGPIVSAADCTYWSDKHRFLYDSFTLPPYYFKKYNDFYALYKKVSAVVNYIDSEGEVIEANQQFLLNENVEEILLLRYLTHYEILYGQVCSLDFLVSKKYDQIASTGFLTVCEKNNLLLPVKSLNPLRMFMKNFRTPYHEMLGKYRIEYEGDDQPSYSLADLLKHHGIAL